MSYASEKEQVDYIFRKYTECLPSCFAKIIESKKTLTRARLIFQKFGAAPSAAWPAKKTQIAEH